MSSILSFTSSLFFQPKCNSWAKISKASPKYNDWLTYAGLVAIRLQLDFTDLLVDGEVSELHVAPNVEVQSLAPANPTVLVDLHRLRHVVERWGSGKYHDKYVCDDTTHLSLTLTNLVLMASSMKMSGFHRRSMSRESLMRT